MMKKDDSNMNGEDRKIISRTESALNYLVVYHSNSMLNLSNHNLFALYLNKW